MRDYTLVVGLDHRHLEQLYLTWPTWKRHKPSLLDHPMLIFYDHKEVDKEAILQLVDHPRLTLQKWPPMPTYYEGTDESKWENAQRHKMLTGFVYVGSSVETDYWLKIDTDVVATGHDDWIDPEWFQGNPAIVSQGWHYTKPANQMLKLDEWVHAYKDDPFLTGWSKFPPLGLAPKPGDNKVKHKRIISWCAFFDSEFTSRCVEAASDTCGSFKMPVPSQDGFLWYMAMRGRFGVNRVEMRDRGWIQKNSMGNIRQAAMEAMK